MARVTMSPAVLEIVAARFKALGEPVRLQILTALKGREATVGELVERTGLGQPNLSKHLQVLHALGFVNRRKEGLFVYYGLADQDVFRLCDIMCGRVKTETSTRRRLFASR
jgi:ArsR family transcriptional regulator